MTSWTDVGARINLGHQSKQRERITEKISKLLTTYFEIPT